MNINNQLQHKSEKIGINNKILNPSNHAWDWDEDTSQKQKRENEHQQQNNESIKPCLGLG